MMLPVWTAGWRTANARAIPKSVTLAVTVFGCKQDVLGFDVPVDRRRYVVGVF